MPGLVLFLKFILNKGSLKELGNDYPDTKGLSPFKSMSELKIDEEGSAIIKRYFAVQLKSLHFCGNPGLNLTFEEGIRHLLLTYPMIIAAAALKAGADKKKYISPQNVAYAVRIIDHTFYHSPFFTLKHVKKMVKWLTNEKNFPSVLRFC